jgi:DNA-binding transcriptional MerR regulator
MEKVLPSIPVKRYFTIGEVSDLCGVKPYVLRYWEQEFSQLRPMKRRGNRRYYQHHEVLLIRRIRELLYDEGFTISGARNRLSDLSPARESLMSSPPVVVPPPGVEVRELNDVDLEMVDASAALIHPTPATPVEKPQEGKPDVAPERPVGIEDTMTWSQVRDELISIRALLV